MNDTEIVLAREHDRDALRRAVRDRTMEKIRRGAYRARRDTTGDRHQDARERAVARVVAVSSQLTMPS